MEMRSVRVSKSTIAQIVLAVGLVFALVKLKELVLVFLTSLVIASFVRTVARRLHRNGLNTTLAVVLLYLVIVGILGLLLFIFVPFFVKEITQVLPTLAGFLPKETIDGAGALSDGLLSNKPISLETIDGFISNVSSGFVGTISGIFGSLINAVLILVFSFYLSIDRYSIDSFLRIISRKYYEDYVVSLWHRSQKKIAYWATGQIVIGLIVGILSFIGLSALGVPYPFLLAILAGVLEIIPFGIFLAVIPAVSIAFMAGGLPLGLLTAVLYIFIQQLEGYVLAPLVIGRFAGVSPLIALLSILIGATLFGFFGIILAVPVAVTILEYLNDKETGRMDREVENTRLALEEAGM